MIVYFSFIIIWLISSAVSDQTIDTRAAANKTTILQTKKRCLAHESCETRQLCPYIQGKYQQVLQSPTPQQQLKLVNHLKSIVCNREIKGFCCPKLEANKTIIPQTDKTCPAHETCELMEACLYIQQAKYQQYLQPNAQQKSQFAKYFYSNICNREKNAFCCPKLGKQVYQFNAAGNIECERDSDCPPDWIDPDCEYVEDDGRQVFHCRNITHSHSCHNSVCRIDYDVNCYTDEATGTEHYFCGECLRGPHFSTKQFIKDREEEEKNCKTQKRPEGTLDTDIGVYISRLWQELGINKDCRTFVHICGIPSARGVRLLRASAITVLGFLRVQKSNNTCPQFTCRRKNRCCQLAYYAGIFVCPYFC